MASLEEGHWLQLSSPGPCDRGGVNNSTTSRAWSGPSQAKRANPGIAHLPKCTDAESENLAYEPPAVEQADKRALDVAAMKLMERAAAIKGSTMASMSPGEKLFYERCTLCHVPREPGDFTKNQWHGITQSMFPRAGLNDQEKDIVLKFLEANAKDAGPM